MARENLQKTLRREREADARYGEYIAYLVERNKRRHEARLRLAQMAGMFSGVFMDTPPATDEGGDDGRIQG